MIIQKLTNGTLEPTKQISNIKHRPKLLNGHRT